MSVGTARFDRTNVAALIPAYCEQSRIYEVARRTCAQLTQVLVVDDGSADLTAGEAQKSGAEVLRHPVNLGKGAAIKSGLKALSARPEVEYIIVLDGDGQHLPEEIPRFIEEANRSAAPIILGNRMSDLSAMPLVRKATNLFMSAQISAVCGQKIPDTQCGFRMISRSLVPALVGCESSRYDFESEMLVIFSRSGCQIASVPVSTVYGDEKSKIHPVQDTLRFFKLMRRLKREARG